MIKKLILILTCTTLYTIIRYAVFGHVSVAHIPVYLLNKSISMGSVICLFLAALGYRSGKAAEAKFFGVASFHCVCMHILLSLSILSAAYYPKFFGADKMNLVGELTLLFGALATYFYFFVCPVRAGSVHLRKFQLLASALIGGHLVAMGWAGWWSVGKWHGGLPPISLISFLFAGASFVLFLRPARRGGE